MPHALLSITRRGRRHVAPEWVPRDPPASRTVLLTGATGYVGGRLLPALEARGLGVRCLARRPAYLSRRVGPRTEVVAGDITLVPLPNGVHCRP